MSTSTGSSNSSSINNACHSALECRDVLLLIFDHLGGTVFDGRDGVERLVHAGTYACCARVCWAFYEPATRMLWSELQSLSQLFNLLRVNPIVPTVESFYDRRVSTVVSDEAYYAAVSVGPTTVVVPLVLTRGGSRFSKRNHTLTRTCGNASCGTRPWCGTSTF